MATGPWPASGSRVTSPRTDPDAGRCTNRRQTTHIPVDPAEAVRPHAPHGLARVISDDHPARPDRRRVGRLRLVPQAARPKRPPAGPHLAQHLPPLLRRSAALGRARLASRALAIRRGGAASHRDGRGARLARRDDREYGQYLGRSNAARRDAPPGDSARNHGSRGLGTRGTHEGATSPRRRAWCRVAMGAVAEPVCPTCGRGPSYGCRALPVLRILVALRAFTAFVLALLALDLGVFHRHAHAVSFREATAWSAVWVALALVFNYLFYLYARAAFASSERLLAVPGFDPDARRGRPLSSSSPGTSSRSRWPSTTSSCSSWSSPSSPFRRSTSTACSTTASSARSSSARSSSPWARCSCSTDGSSSPSASSSSRPASR
jgi:hypothetical protein